MQSKQYNGPIPQLRAIRRVPTRYQQLLPLEWMKQHQCIVVGGAGGMLTIAITDAEDKSLIGSMEKLIRHRIFTVLIEPARMRLLIERMERDSYRQQKSWPCSTHYIHQHLLRGILQLLNWPY